MEHQTWDLNGLVYLVLLVANAPVLKMKCGILQRSFSFLKTSFSSSVVFSVGGRKWDMTMRNCSKLISSKEPTSSWRWFLCHRQKESTCAWWTILILNISNRVQCPTFWSPNQKKMYTHIFAYGPFRFPSSIWHVFLWTKVHVHTHTYRRVHIAVCHVKLGLWGTVRLNVNSCVFKRIKQHLHWVFLAWRLRIDFHSLLLSLLVAVVRMNLHIDSGERLILTDA